MSDRWDAEAGEIAQQIAQVSVEHVRDRPRWCGREWCLNEEGECQVAAGAHDISALARHAQRSGYRAGLERAAEIASMDARDCPDHPLHSDAHDWCHAALAIEVAIRHEIEALDKENA